MGHSATPEYITGSIIPYDHQQNNGKNPGSEKMEVRVLYHMFKAIEIGGTHPLISSPNT